MSVKYCDFTIDGMVFNNSFTRKKAFILTEFCDPCEGGLYPNPELIYCDCEFGGYNCNRCGNDPAYWIPFILNDTFTFQFQFIDLLNDPNNPTYGWFNSGSPDWLLKANAYECCDLDQVTPFELSPAYVNQFVGFVDLPTWKVPGSTTTKQLQQMEFNPNLIPWDCFYIVFELKLADGDPAPVQLFCSEPFKKAPCTGDNKTSNTFGISSGFDTYDNFGHIYCLPSRIASGGVFFTFNNFMRFNGTIEQQNISFEKEYLNDWTTPVDSTQSMTYLLRTYPTPAYAARYLGNTLAGFNIYYNDNNFATPNYYRVESEVSKQNENGQAWIMDVTLKHTYDKRSFNCDICPPE